MSSLVKSGDTGNGVTFRSGDNVDLGPSRIGVSFIDTAMQMVTVNVSGEQVENNFANPVFNVDQGGAAAVVKTTPAISDPSAQMKDEKAPVEGDGGRSDPSPFVPPAKNHKKERPTGFSPTEDTFTDTATLVREDSDV
ncbi:hypothetical protein CRUP_011326 [Coryphaenoides rupestris]|nr:hypothetical protein CRUP_011326 [Coryphaenoides rupestris]